MKHLMICELFHIASRRIIVEAVVDIDAFKVLEKKLTMNSVEISLDEAIKTFLKNLDEAITAFNVYISTTDGLRNLSSWVFGISKDVIEEFGINPQTFFPTLFKKIWNDIDSIIAMDLVKKYKIDDLEVIVGFERSSISSIEYIEDEEDLLDEEKVVTSIKRYKMGFVPEIDSEDGDIYGKDIIEIRFKDGTSLHLVVSGWNYDIISTKGKGRIALPREKQVEKAIKNYNKTIEKLDSLF